MPGKVARIVLYPDNADPLAERSPVLAGMTAASVQGRVATGERAGRIVRRVLSDPAAAVRTSALCFASRGFSLHVATRIAADDKPGLERLCRYVARPPLAAGRLEQQGDDKLSFALKTPRDDGSTHIVLSPLELLEKLAALVPPPRVNLVR
ncbi:MAG: transposase [Myxococcota bacterium]|nr:transposase [Myxococcota bacterium]